MATVVNRLGVRLVKAGMGKLLDDAAFTANLCIFSVDDEGFRWCKSVLAQPDHCLRTRATLRDSVGRGNDYERIVWMKWHVVKYSLQLPGVESVFFLDADTAVFKPFDDLVKDWDYDFRYQVENAPAHGLNGGQIWFNRTNVALRYIERVLENDRDTRTIDQVYAARILPLFPKLRKAPLSPSRFSSYCMTKDQKTVITSRTRTFHTPCTPVGKEHLLMEAHRAYRQSVPAPIAHFIPDKQICCVQGRADYLQEKLETIQASADNSAHRRSVVRWGTCAGAGYQQNSAAEMCFPNATLHTKKSHPITTKNMTDPTVIAACTLKALTHGVAAMSNGTAKICQVGAEG